MKELKTVFEEFSFEDAPNLPEMDLIFSACRVSADKQSHDVVDLKKRKILRWTTPHIKVQPFSEKIKKYILANWPKDEIDFDSFWTMAVKSHVAQLSNDGKKLIVATGQITSGFCALVIDTEKHKTFIFPEDFDEKLMLYTATGDFTPDNKSWLFIRWPLDDTLDILRGKKKTARCEIGRMDLSTLESEIIYRLDSIDNIHQITASDDGRYVVFTPFNFNPRIPYPAASMEEDPEGYRRSHEAGLETTKMITVDLHKMKHWKTEIPVPCPAHFEFDPADPHVFYVSAHNFSVSARGEAVLEGPGAVFKMRIMDGKTIFDGQYSDNEFFRITQHMPLRFNNRTLVAVTNLPNKLDILDGENMTLWHREQIFPSPPLDLSKTGNLACPMFPKSCYSINPSDNGQYIVLESAIGLIIFDVKNRRFLDLNISRRIPEGFGGLGHTRLKGN